VLCPFKAWQSMLVKLVGPRDGPRRLARSTGPLRHVHERSQRLPAPSLHIYAISC